MRHKHFLVAGGSSGIGLELVRALTAGGDRVTCACRDPAPLGAIEGVETVPFDAADPEPTAELPPTLDGFVYCPGTINLKPFHRLGDADFLRDFEVNLLGAVRLLRLALPALKGAGSASVVLFSSVAAQTGLPFHASIAAAKGAVEGLVRSLAAELAPAVRVNGIAPSLTDTKLAAGLLDSEAKRHASAERHPLKRIGDPAGAASLAAFLLSDAAGFVSGQIFKVDGGLSALKPL